MPEATTTADRAAHTGGQNTTQIIIAVISAVSAIAVAFLGYLATHDGGGSKKPDDTALKAAVNSWTNDDLRDCTGDGPPEENKDVRITDPPSETPVVRDVFMKGEVNLGSAERLYVFSYHEKPDCRYYFNPGRVEPESDHSWTNKATIVDSPGETIYLIAKVVDGKTSEIFEQIRKEQKDQAHVVRLPKPYARIAVHVQP